MDLPDGASCFDPHRGRRVAEWLPVDFEECAHFSELAADEARLAAARAARIPSTNPPAPAAAVVAATPKGI